MSKSVCGSCLKPKATLQCGPCETPLCKSCASFLDEERFAYMPVVPENVRHAVYCHSCFAENVIPAEAAYDQDVERAKQVLIFYKNEHKETRFVKRLEDPVTVKACVDREETILRLAFQAVIKGYNAVLDVDLFSEKIRTGAYQTKMWHAAGVPAQVDKIPRPQQHT